MNAMTIAIKTETDAIAFYKEAAQRTRNPMGREMFLSLVRDEQNHLEDFRHIIDGLHLKFYGDDGKTKTMKTVFEVKRGALLGRIRAATDEIEVLRLAIQMERESIAFYEKLSRRAKTPKEKELFRRLLKEEQQHYAVFSNTYFFLSNAENWFMWEEHSIADGGTPWA